VIWGSAHSIRLRPGEAFGLEWSVVNWEDGEVEVMQALVRKRGGGWCLEEPKTKGSVRTVPASPYTRAYVLTHGSVSGPKPRIYHRVEHITRTIHTIA